MLAPHMDIAAVALRSPEGGGGCRVVKFNADHVDGPEIASALGVGAFPALLYVSKGTVARRAEGPHVAEAIVAMAEEAFGVGS